MYHQKISHFPRTYKNIRTHLLMGEKLIILLSYWLHYTKTTSKHNRKLLQNKNFYVCRKLIIIFNGDPITCNELFGGPSDWYPILMDLAVPVYIYIRLTFLPIYLANTNRFPFNVINWAGETLNLKKWNKCKCFLLSKIRCRSSLFC